MAGDAQNLSIPDTCDEITDFWNGPDGDLAYYMLWRRHLATDIPHDAYPGVLNLPSKLWRLYGNTAWKAAESPSLWGGVGTLRTKGDIGHSLPEPMFLEAILDLLNRRDNEIVFNLSRETDAYTNEGVVNLYPQGSVVAKYRDAGLNITPNQFTGVELVPMMNPGSMIDPALQGWPNNAFVPASPNFDLPGWFFGFNPDVVRSVSIRGFTGNKVQIGFEYKSPGGGFVLYDGASKSPAVGGRLTFKTVNDSKTAGYFGGNETNKKLGGLDEDVPYFVGKFLCDALQFVLLMPCLPDLGQKKWINNPFYPIGSAGTFRRFTTATSGSAFAPGTEPKIGHPLGTTGDALNYTRAVLLRISAIYISPPNAQKVWSCRFMPGRDMVIDNLAYCKKTYDAIDEIIKLIEKRYIAAIKAVDGSIRDQTNPANLVYFNVLYSKVSGDQQLSTDVHQELANEFMKHVKQCISNAKAEIDVYIAGLKALPRADTQAAAALAREELSVAFKALGNALPSLAPKGPFVLVKPGGETGSVIQTYTIAEPEKNSYRVKFAKAFAEIKRQVAAHNGERWWLTEGKAANDAMLTIIRDNSLISPMPAQNAAGGMRRKTGRKRKSSRRAIRKYRGGADPRGSDTGTLAINAFSGLINAGIAFYSLNERKDTMKDFLEEANADRDAYEDRVLANTPKVGKYSLEDIGSIAGRIVNNGNTTLADFVQFVQNSKTELENVGKPSPPLPAWDPNAVASPPGYDIMSIMKADPDSFMSAVDDAVTYIENANRNELRDETLYIEMKSELDGIIAAAAAAAAPPVAAAAAQVVALPAAAPAPPDVEEDDEDEPGYAAGPSNAAAGPSNAAGVQAPESGPYEDRFGLPPAPAPPPAPPAPVLVAPPPAPVVMDVAPAPPAPAPVLVAPPPAPVVMDVAPAPPAPAPVLVAPPPAPVVMDVAPAPVPAPVLAAPSAAAELLNAQAARTLAVFGQNRTVAERGAKAVKANAAPPRPPVAARAAAPVPYFPPAPVVVHRLNLPDPNPLLRGRDGKPIYEPYVMTGETKSKSRRVYGGHRKTHRRRKLPKLL